MSRKTPWQLAPRPCVIDAHEVTLLHERHKSTWAKLGSPVGCVVRVISQAGEPTGWQAYAFTSGKRRAINDSRTWAKIGHIESGPGSKFTAAAAAWSARTIEAVPAHKPERMAPSSYGLGTYRRPA